VTTDDLFQHAVRHAQAGRLADAIDLLRQVLAADPSHIAALNNLGVCLRQSGRGAEATEHFRQALAIAPDRPHVWNNLGNALRGAGRLDEAASAYERCLSLDSNNTEALSNLGTCRKDGGRIDEALALYRRSLATSPSPVVHGNLLYAMHFQEAVDSLELLREHRAWAARYADPLRERWQPIARDPTRRRLRIGYVSPDLRLHPVGRFLLPLLRHHDRRHFDIFCYATNRAPDDAFSQRLRDHADHWRSAGAMSDDELAALIRADGIDILVDLSLHMAGNRLLAFARRPAPVQVTYLGYCGTSGMGAMDFRLTDPHLDPPGGDDARYSEDSVRLPETYWCYEPATDDVPVQPPPSAAMGRITFGCLNNFAKVSDVALGAWAEVLRAVPRSSLLLHAHQGSHRHRVSEAMTHRGIDPARVDFVGFVPLDEFFRLHDRIDIALDPFPYAGGTTTCDALWMGVPAVTLAGPTAVGRGGASILTNVGLAELIAGSMEQYMHIAAELAEDRARLAELRRSLRDRMQQSPLMDGDRFARHIEAAYRQMWVAGQT